MAATAVAMWTVAYNAVIPSRTTKITMLEYQRHDVKRLRRELLTAPLFVSLTYRGGKHGHAFFNYDKQGYKDYTWEDITQIHVPQPPITPNIINGASSDIIAFKTADTAAKLDAHYIK